MARYSISKELIALFIYAAVAGLVWGFGQLYPSDMVSKILISVLLLASLHFLFRIVLRQLLLRLKDSRLRQHLRKLTAFAHWLIAALTIMRVWVADPGSLLVAYGIVGAGIAIALQDLLKNMAGGVSIYMSAPYSVGDRIEINGLVGDVMDIGVASTTLMEIRDWVGSDQATGRLVVMPNGQIFTESIKNYTKDHEFIWDEIRLPVTYASDWKRAADELRKIAEEETAEAVTEARRALSRMESKYYVSGRQVEPSVYITFDDNWVLLSVRYVTHVRGRRNQTSRLSARILDLVNSSSDITLSSENSVIAISNVPEVRIKTDQE